MSSKRKKSSTSNNSTSSAAMGEKKPRGRPRKHPKAASDGGGSAASAVVPLKSAPASSSSSRAQQMSHFNNHQRRRSSFAATPGRYVDRRARAAAAPSESSSSDEQMSFDEDSGEDLEYPCSAVVVTAQSAANSRSVRARNRQSSQFQERNASRDEEEEDIDETLFSLPDVSPPPPVNRVNVVLYEQQQDDPDQPDFAEITRWKNNKLLTTFINTAGDATEDFVTSSYAAAIWCSQSFDESSDDTAHSASLLLNKSIKYINNKKSSQRRKSPMTQTKRKKSLPRKHLRFEIPIPVDQTVMHKFCSSEGLLSDSHSNSNSLKNSESCSHSLDTATPGQTISALESVFSKF
eukprot:TRINITY_DN10838_c0_g1_i4.p1 TRINITY_DN10838_c0_g1~~TRINITY_DN10838_c0_g1_i4.p1  ORF type:complete len:370 (+),score=85.88 TRINITY_DN10838_c0_g1_i4:65-1111(+)